MPLTLEHVSTIEADAARIRDAYSVAPDARIPWSDRWTVRSVARHVAAAHHLVAGVIHGRPTADFGLADSLAQPAKGDPGFPDWSAAGTAAVCDALRTTGLDEPCWTSIPAGRGVRYWLRRLTVETLVHRWDAELGAGLDHLSFDLEVSTEGIDEFLTLALPLLREDAGSPGAPSVHLACTDADGSWFVELADGGRTSVGTEPVPVTATVRGPAAGLLLWLYDRVPCDEAGIEIAGATTGRRAELLPI